MTTTKLRSSKLFRPSLSLSLMIVGLIITISFIVIALFAPAWQAWGWIQDPTESLINPIHQPPGLDFPYFIWYASSVKSSYFSYNYESDCRRTSRFG